MDLNYKPDLEERIFKFDPPRETEWTFELPAYLQQINDVFRIDADGIYDVNWNQIDGSVEISDQASQVMIYIATYNPELRFDLEIKHQNLVKGETAVSFDPVGSDTDFHILQKILTSAD